MKKHDEAKDVQILKRKMYVDTNRKVIEANKSLIIGNKSWGRIDYLTHYCGYVFIWNNDIKITKDNYSNNDNTNKKEELRKIKQQAKEHTLSNKNSKRKSA